jgi:alpha-D-ribose 1-methylphosphonate 5-triphosphate synthase subunit PhnH
MTAPLLAPPGPADALGAGLTDPVHDAQRVFRALLEAMSLPGQLRSPALPDAMRAPRDARGVAWDPALAALALTLLDTESPVHLAGALDTPAARAWLRFHTGAPVVPPETAAFTLALARALDGEQLARLPLGHDDHPQDGATLVLQVTTLAGGEEAAGSHERGGTLLDLQGPGIPGRRRLRVGGVPAGLWRWRVGLEAAYPRGVDLVLCQGHRFAALPRSTRVTIDTLEA